MNPNPDLQCVRLQFPCPPVCPCQSIAKRNWVHQSCYKNSYITEKGDIFCNQKDCQSYFIKDAQFQCQEVKQSSSYYKYKSISEFAMGLALAIQAADYELKGNNLVHFITTLNSQVAIRWNS
ncbi:unnamed protein product (macronuclear) [Paramecium tetraurelia]|uniref:Uncharacterized protein n=1 Tax=Paramecium tetraurelia TaxID=5888 RepID=A0DXJ5_PARTE|nr:uncharacterized protein GSPATT00021386001 [Paramecium tetraurelia]CAK87762.1 unnamed protein product [Paramecium tetraurelia]|eukprot:XP_001455159.1 hypothetical protein (macronuclear) [Paramecium tetraurelia strain d4-2]